MYAYSEEYVQRVADLAFSVGGWLRSEHRVSLKLDDEQHEDDHPSLILMGNKSDIAACVEELTGVFGLRHYQGEDDQHVNGPLWYVRVTEG